MMYNLITKELENFKCRSAWDRAVNDYAFELIEGIDFETISNTSELKEVILNSAKDFREYSYCGSSLVCDYTIAKRCCTPSEFKRTKEGSLNPNSRENWLDVQARALYQAYNRIESIYRKIKEV